MVSKISSHVGGSGKESRVPLTSVSEREASSISLKRDAACFGVDARFEDVAEEAGVGRGTLYRHFPTRDHLFVAILQDRVDFLDTKARELLDAPDAWQALSEWLRLFDQSAAEYGGMSARLGSSLADDGSPVATLCGPMKANFAHLVERAKRETPLRPDVAAIPLLAMISGLPKDPQSGKTLDSCLDIVLRGLPASRRRA